MKKGIDYFPLDVSLSDEFALIEIKFGLIGFGAIIKLLQKIYSDNGYYFLAKEKNLILFASRIGVDFSLLKEIINYALDLGLFNKEIYEKHEIITSKGIQERFFEITKRRKTIEVIEEVLLVPKQENFILICHKSDNVCKVQEGSEKMHADVNMMQADAYIFEQSKVKESKAEKSKGERSKNKEAHAYGVMNNVYLTDSEFNALKNAFPNYEEKINNLSLYMSSSGKKYKDHYATILRWDLQDKSKKETKEKVKKKETKISSEEEYHSINNFTDEEIEMIMSAKAHSP